MAPSRLRPSTPMATWPGSMATLTRPANLGRCPMALAASEVSYLKALVLWFHHRHSTTRHPPTPSPTAKRTTDSTEKTRGYTKTPNTTAVRPNPTRSDTNNPNRNSKGSAFHLNRRNTSRNRNYSTNRSHNTNRNRSTNHSHSINRNHSTNRKHSTNRNRSTNLSNLRTSNKRAFSTRHPRRSPKSPDPKVKCTTNNHSSLTNHSNRNRYKTTNIKTTRVRTTHTKTSTLSQVIQHRISTLARDLTLLILLVNKVADCFNVYCKFVV